LTSRRSTVSLGENSKPLSMRLLIIEPSLPIWRSRDAYHSIMGELFLASAAVGFSPSFWEFYILRLFPPKSGCHVLFL